MSRHDIHRHSRLIPSDYEYIASYNLSTRVDGWPVPSYGVNCELDKRHLDPETGKWVMGEHAPDGMCCIVAMRHHPDVRFARHGGTGQCTACGTRFVYGDLWRHIETGEVIHLGHVCASKVGLHADRTEYEVERDRIRRATLSRLEKERKTEARSVFLEEHPGLEEALKTDHDIVRDIRAQFKSRCYLSERQIELVLKLKEEAEAPPAEEEPKVPAPHGERREFEGEVVSVKWQENFYGPDRHVMTVKVWEQKGAWLVWGTVPRAIDDVYRGDRVRLTATLTRSDRDESFAFMKRPSKAVVLERGDEYAKFNEGVMA